MYQMSLLIACMGSLWCACLLSWHVVGRDWLPLCTNNTGTQVPTMCLHVACMHDSLTHTPITHKGMCDIAYTITIQQLAQLELLCRELYESHDPDVRAQAEKTLVGFTESQDSLPQCQLILEQSQSPYALLLAASTMTKLVTRTTTNLSIQDRLQLSRCTSTLQSKPIWLLGAPPSNVVSINPSVFSYTVTSLDVPYNPC